MPCNHPSFKKRKNTAAANLAPCDATPRDEHIQILGTPSRPSPMPFCQFVPDELYPFYLNNNLLGGEDASPRLFNFELAGARQNIFFNPAKTRCAIVTCGGLCPGINDVIRAIVMQAHHNYGVAKVLGVRYGLQGFIPEYGHEIIELDPQNVRNIQEFGGTILGTSRGPQDPARILDRLIELDVNILFVIGGDGSLKAAAAIAKEAARRKATLAVIGIPKTIDNDINFIAQSFGFETAVEKATEAIQCAHTEALGAPYGLGLVKLMGRESGFIAAQATLSSREVNFVLTPEVEFTLNGHGGFLPALEARLKERGHAVVVLAEGAGQHLLVRAQETDASGNRVLADIATYLQAEIKSYLQKHNLPVSIKYIDPSYIIRSVPANSEDSVYCGLLGQYAVHAAMAGKTEMVVAKLMDQYVHLPLELVTRCRRRLNISSDYWRTVLETTGQSNLAGMLINCPLR